MSILLHSLGAAGQQLQLLDDTAAQLQIVKELALDGSHLEESRSLREGDNTELWNQLAENSLAATDISRALAAAMSLALQSQALPAATIYTHILMAHGCPVLTMFDRVTCSAFLKLLRDAAVASAPRTAAKGKGGAGEGEGEGMDVDCGDAPPKHAPKGLKSGAGILLADPIRNFSKVLSGLGLRDQPDTARAVAETFTTVAGAPGLPSEVADAAYSVLLALLDPAHGPVESLSATVLRLLTPHLLGSDGGGKAAVGGAKTAAAVRARAVTFVEQVLEKAPESAEAVAALARHAAMKAPDRAEGRAAAVYAAMALCRALGDRELLAFVTFVARLSRTAKAPLRLVGVELAAALLDAFENPFEARAAEAAAQGRTGPAATLVPPAVAALRRNQQHHQQLRRGSAAASTPGSHLFAPAASHTFPGVGGVAGPDGQPLAAAPWGAVCLAVLVQRCSDKAAAVRARALHHLAAAATSRARASCLERHVDGFTAALAAAHAINLQPSRACRSGSGAAAGSPMPDTPASGGGGEGATPMTVDGENTPEGNNLGSGSAGRSGAAKSATGASSSADPEKAFPFFMPAALTTPGVAGIDLSLLLAIARKRCGDDKGNVRKAGVQLLEAVLILQAAANSSGQAVLVLPAAEDIAALEDAAGDPLLSVRRAALAAAGSLSRALPRDTAVATLWARAALPLVRDAESSIQEALLDQFHDLVISKAAAAAATSARSHQSAPGGGPPPATAAAAQAAAELRPLLAALSRGGAACKACMGRATSQLRAKGRLQAKKAAAGLERTIGGLGRHGAGSATDDGSAAFVGQEESGAWLLYAEVAAQDPSAPSWQFLHAAWAKFDSTPANFTMHTEDESNEGERAACDDHAAQLLRVIAAAAAEFPAPQAAALCSQLRSAVQALALPPAPASAHIAALAQLTRAHGGSETMAHLAAGLLSTCEQALAAHIASFSGGGSSGAAPDGRSAAQDAAPPAAGDDRAAAALFAAGEAALLRAARPSARLVTLVQALTAHSLAAFGAALSGDEEGQQQRAADARRVGGGSTVGTRAVGAVVQAHAWVALGKLCLTDEGLAKKCVPLFVQELSLASPPAVRNNILVALSDLVVHYTALVDSHIPRLAACIRDPHELVRAQALALLANLLQKDYVKWRGPLFHRFLLALIDDSPRVAALAEFLLGDALSTKVPNLAYNHFVEALYVLNDCQVGLAGGAAAAAALADLGHWAGACAEREAFTLKGGSPAQRAKRDAIYSALLRRMAPEHKFATAARLCQEVLGGAADNGLPLSNPECCEVVGDALRVLASKHIKVAASRAADDPDAAEIDATAVVGAAKGRLVSQMMKKHLVEGVVPVVIELKRAMEAAHHPLLGDLMAAAAAMLKDHTSEIEDILAADGQLAKEILYDLRQAEARAAEIAAAAAVAASTDADAEAEAAGVQPLATGAKTPGVRPGSGSGWTPWTGGSARSGGSLPAGASATTPMAAEVLMQTAIKRPAPAPGSAAAARARLQSVGKTPGGALLAATTPGSEWKTPGGGLTGGGGGARSSGGSTASRLARSSGPPPGSAARAAGLAVAVGHIPLALGQGGEASPSVPRLKPGRTPLRRPSRLGPQRQLAENSAADGSLAGGGGDVEEDRVRLPFALPQASGQPPPLWNVPAGVVPAEAAAKEAGPQPSCGADAMDEDALHALDGAAGDPCSFRCGGGGKEGGGRSGRGRREGARQKRKA